MNKVKLLSVLFITWTLVDISFARDIPTIKVPYECHSEVNVITDSFTMLVDEWTHESGDYYHIENRKSYEIDDYYLNYPENELYSVQNEKCKTTKLDTKDKHLDNYFLSILQNETFVSVAALLEYAPKKLTMTQITGSQTIRGVKSDCWEGTQQDLKIKICWSDDAWNKVQDQNSAPVFLGVTGTNKNTKGETVNVNIEAHILFFIEGVSSDSMELFQTPIGLYCSDRKFTKTLPSLPNVISYYQESVVENPSVNGIANNRLIFDRNLNIVRFEYQDAIPKAPFYAWGTIIVIKDYTSGVAYYQDSLLGNCTVQPIQSNDENKQVTNGSANFFELKNPNEVFRLDGTYSYVGEKTLRGIPAKYYISKRTDFKFPFLAGMNTTFSFFFLPSYLTSTTVGDTIGINSDVPLQMIISPYSDTPEDEMGTYKQTFNFFNFAETKNSDGNAMIGETPGWEYDIRSCYESKDEKEVRIVFGTSELGKDLVKETRLFPRLVMTKILQLFPQGKVGPLRLQHPEVDYNQTTVFVTFTIMPKPDLSKMNVTVSSFADETTVDDIVKVIRDSVENGGLVVDLQLSNGGNVSYFGLEFKDDLFRVNDDLFPIVGNHLEQFTRIDNKEIEGTRQLFGQYLADECARQCLEDGSAQGCASFTYRYKYGFCSLSSYDPTKNPNKTTEASDAVLFTKNVMSRYEKSSGDIKRGYSGGDVVKSLTECATKCNEKCTTNDCKCRSFDYCKRQKKSTTADIGEIEEVCFLATTHNSDSKPTNTDDSIDCQHYLRGFSADFQKKFESAKVTLEPYTVQYNVNEDTCAKTCIENIGDSCKGYYFCPSTSKSQSACAGVKATQNEQEKENGNNQCVYYTRTSSTDGSPYKPPTTDGSTSTAAPSTNKVSPGLTAGLVILFFVLGMVIMFIVLQFVMKKSVTGSGGDDVKIYYSPKE